MKIKPITIEDVNLLQEISTLTFEDTFAAVNTPKDIADYVNEAYTIPQLTSELSNPASFYFFIWEAGEVAGYLKLNIDQAQTEAMGSDAIEIQRIYIRPEFKHQGLGKALFQTALKVASDQGKTKIWLGVWEHNKPALAFYEKLGFKQDGHHDFYMGTDQQTDLIMVKTLVG